VSEREHLVDGGPGPGWSLVDERNAAHLDDRAPGDALVGEDAAEQHQEHQREQDREEQRSLSRRKPTIMAHDRLRKAVTGETPAP